MARANLLWKQHGNYSSNTPKSIDSSWRIQGSLEAWLLLRSLRTLQLRVSRQSETATALAAWLDKVSKIPGGQQWDGVQGGVILKVWHSSLQSKEKFDPAIQLEGGYNATFAILLADPDAAKALPHKVKYLIVCDSVDGREKGLTWPIACD